MEAELKCRNTAPSASGLSFARCWLRAGNKFLGRDFFASLEIGIGMDSIL